MYVMKSGNIVNLIARPFSSNRASPIMKMIAKGLDELTARNRSVFKNAVDFGKEFVI